VSEIGDRFSPVTTPLESSLELDFNLENPRYLTDQLITYIGNKRSLGAPISNAVERIKKKMGQERLRTADVFAGSGFVSRLLKRHSSYLASNDFEKYSSTGLSCFLSNFSTVDFDELNFHVKKLNELTDNGEFHNGFIRELYAPQFEGKITKDDRVFYTIDNARRLDTFANYLKNISEPARTLLLGPLLSSASIHANTAGVFKGFYKNNLKGIGSFGGTNSDALKRILGKIEMQVPILSRFESEVETFQLESLAFAKEVKDLDLAYLDPPYNQHPYGSNYFMLNLICNYERPHSVSKVSGIPDDWQRSDYNVRSKAAETMRSLISAIDARFLLISFSDEGFISPEVMREMLLDFGTLSEEKIPYTVYRGSRNIQNRSKSVNEHLYLVERN
jgi:adenine-specific DNA-methyltransferase